jgi:hypothetical protein
MKAIIDERITKTENGFTATCVNCSAILTFSTKASILRMLKNSSCRNCKKDYRNLSDTLPIYKNKEGKWCSTCSSCGGEQAYTRKDHAKQSTISDWKCKPCVGSEKSFSNNQSVGNKRRLFNKFSKSAKNRNIDWELTLEDMFESYTGFCNLTNWKISIDYSGCNASLDRIDNSKGYTKDNIQWVHVMVNMSKNKYTQDEFLAMCLSIARTQESRSYSG